MIEDLTLTGIAMTLVVALTVWACIFQRIHRRTKNPPLTAEEKTRQLEESLAAIDEEIKKLGE